MKNVKSNAYDLLVKYGTPTVVLMAAVGPTFATSLVDYVSIAALALAEVTAAIAAGVTFWGTVRGAKAGMAFIKGMLSGR